MKTTAILLITAMIFGNMIIFNFDKDVDLRDWTVVDDVVMGGRSDGSFSINDDGDAVFEGRVSLDNNGGFSSVRYRTEATDVRDYKKIKIRIKGDGKSYQFRVKTSRYDRHSYIYSFETSGKWETITIPLHVMKPSFRGMSLDMKNYPGETMEELAILIGNKRPESFKLVIDQITAE